MPNLLRVILPSAAFLLLGARAEASSLYTITDLGTLPGTTHADPTAINNLGQVAGYSFNVDGQGHQTNQQSFLYSGDQMTPITFPGGVIPKAINDSGTVVGGTTLAVNNAGQTVGRTFEVPYTATVAGVTTTSQATLDPVGINDAGQIAGNLNKPGGGQDAAIYQGGKLVDASRALPNYAEITSQAVTINRAGDVLIQVYNMKTGNGTYALYKADGTAYTIQNGGALDNTFLQATGLNSLGQVIGFNSYGGFIEQGGADTVQLTTLIPPGSQAFWQSLDPAAINDQGQIVGAGMGSDGQEHAFLMTPMPTPTPEPATVLLMVAGIGLFLAKGRGERVAAAID